MRVFTLILQEENNIQELVKRLKEWGVEDINANFKCIILDSVN